MSEIRFYHLQRSRLDEALPVILERCLARGQRAVVMGGSAERVEALSAQLWTYRPDSFLPHGTQRDGEAENQPIWLTERAENPNGAQVLILADGVAHPGPEAFPLVLEMLDGTDTAAVEAGRARWKAYRAAGHSLVYFQQEAAGRWVESARIEGKAAAGAAST